MIDFFYFIKHFKILLILAVRNKIQLYYSFCFLICTFGIFYFVDSLHLFGKKICDWRTFVSLQVYKPHGWVIMVLLVVAHTKSLD
jgi:hypothetical protein